MGINCLICMSSLGVIGIRPAMVRRKIEIKKIDNSGARQVTFSKRRRGLFKKAQELATLCDAQVALLVFSSTARLYEFPSSSRMMELIQRYMKHKDKDGASEPINLSNKKQPGGSNYSMLRKEVYDKTKEMSQLKGEQLDGLDIVQLCKIEEKIEKGLAQIRQIKFDKLQKEIASLKQEVMNGGQAHKSSQQKIQQDAVESINGAYSFTSDQYSTSYGNSIPDTSLTLGLPIRGED